MSTKLEFPCLSMDVNQWFSSSSGSSSGSDSDIAVVREALKNFLMDPLMLEEEEKKDESTTTLNTQWLLNTPTTNRPAKNNSSGSSTPMMTPSDNIMAPVLRETSRDYWLLAGNKNNMNNKEEEVERAPVTDRVPNPSTSLWLAANTDSISSQTAANNITWPQGSTINNNKWLLHSEEEEASKPTPEWLHNWKVATKGSNWLPVAPTGSQWLPSASGAVDWLSMSTSTLSTGSSNPLEDWPLKDTDCSEWLLDASEPEVAPRKRPLSPVIMMWLESAMEEEELEADEEEEDNESSIVVLSEPGTGSDIGAASMEEDGDDDLGFWLL